MAQASSIELGSDEAFDDLGPQTSELDRIGDQQDLVIVNDNARGAKRGLDRYPTPGMTVERAELAIVRARRRLFLAK